MFNIPKLTIAIASTAFLATTRVDSSTTTYDFTVNVNTGSLAGKSFNGSFSYDASTLKKVGKEELTVADGLTVCMNFLGRTYNATDDNNYPNFPKLLFEDGKIKRLDFWIEQGKRVEWWTLPGWQVNYSLRKNPIAKTCQKEQLRAR